jgi:hypothetical protein
MLAAFRSEPPSSCRPRAAAAAAGRAAGLSWSRAQHAWSTGWPELGVEPLNVIVAREQMQARAVVTLAARLADATASAVEDGAQQRAAEAWCARAAGTLAAGLLGEMVQAIVPQVKSLMAGIGAAPPADVADMLDRLRALIGAAGRTIEIAGAAQQQQRLAIGEPGQIVGLISPPTMTPEESARQVEAAKRALRLLELEHPTPPTPADGEKAN